MKINSLPQGSGIPAGSASGSTGRVSNEARERAKAIASGQEPPAIQTEAAHSQNPEPALPRLKLRTNVSPDRFVPEERGEGTPTTTESPVDDLNSKLPTQTDSSEQAADAATEPLSPQVATLAKYKRAVQVKDRQIAELKTALEAAKTPQPQTDWKAQLKADPLSVLHDAGVTYDQLTEAILAGGHNPEVAALKAEIAALKSNVDKSLSARDAQAEQQALTEIQREIDAKVSTSDAYKAIKATGSQNQVKELIHRTWKETGELMDVQEACDLVEAEWRRTVEQIAPPPAPAPAYRAPGAKHRG